MSSSISRRIAEELSVREQQVAAATALLDEGATVPFIARYRKEVTGGLDDSQMRQLEERLSYLRELEERRAAILKSIDEQGKLSDELIKAINSADTKTRLEDLYLPYKPKRRTKAQIAREAGLEPLADLLFSTPDTDPESASADYLNAEAGINDSKAALDHLVGELRDCEELECVELVTGRFVVVIAMDCADMDSFADIAMSRLNTNPNIRHCWTLTRLKQLY